MTLNLTSANQVKQLLAEHGIHPKKRLGQHFLIDRNTLTRIVDACEATPETNVLEIGPGLGVVTRELAERAGRVVCVDIDPDMCAVLEQTVGASPNVEIVTADFLEVGLSDFLRERGDGSWCIVGNLPYYITSPILEKLIEAKSLVNRAVLMIQREVADRLRAAPGSDDYGSLSVFVQYHCIVESVMRVSKNVFYPVPDVDSEVIKLTLRPKQPVPVCNEDLFFRIVRAAFGKRRKTLQNALSSSAELGWDRDTATRALVSAGIDIGRRGETLSIGEFAAISNAAL